MPNRDRFDLLGEVFKALAHAPRLRALNVLGEGPRCVCEVVPALGVDQSTASRHLAALRRAGLVTATRDGNRVMYALANERVLELLDLAAYVAESRLRASAGVLAHAANHWR